YDPALGYVTTDTDTDTDALRLSALSLTGLRRQLAAAYADAEIILSLDKRARSERDARRRAGHGGAEQRRRCNRRLTEYIAEYKKPLKRASCSPSSTRRSPSCSSACR